MARDLRPAARIERGKGKAMSKTEFPVELVERCARAGLPSFRSAGWWVFSPSEGDMSDVERERWEATTSATAAVLRESGHAELVAALTDIGVYGCGMLNQPAAMNGPEEEWLKRRIREYEDRARAALRKAGAL